MKPRLIIDRTQPFGWSQVKAAMGTEYSRCLNEGELRATPCWPPPYAERDLAVE